MIERTTDAAWINSVLNHPDVGPWIDERNDGPIDISAYLESPFVLALRGDHGVFMVVKLDHGIYEVHTAILPEGRGPWARDFARSGAAYMFVGTDAVEILTRVPQPHGAARRLTLDTGFQLEFTTLAETRFRGKMVPVEVYRLSLQDWASSPGIAECSEPNGRTFHEWLNAQVGSGNGAPHADDPAHNRVIGVALSMIRAGQVTKGIVWYNRWAVLARHPTIALIENDPTRVKFDAGILTMAEDGSITYSACH